MDGNVVIRVAQDANLGRTFPERLAWLHDKIEKLRDEIEGLLQPASGSRIWHTHEGHLER